LLTALVAAAARSVASGAIVATLVAGATRATSVVATLVTTAGVSTIRTVVTALVAAPRRTTVVTALVPTARTTAVVTTGPVVTSTPVVTALVPAPRTTTVVARVAPTRVATGTGTTVVTPATVVFAALRCAAVDPASVGRLAAGTDARGASGARIAVGVAVRVTRRALFTGAQRTVSATSRRTVVARDEPAPRAAIVA